MKSLLPARLLPLRALAILVFALLSAACGAGPAEPRDAAADNTHPVAADPATAANTPPATAPLATAGTLAEAHAVVTPAMPAPQAMLADAANARSCKADADCAVKDVGSCCGYHPQCLNKDTATFPDEVKARCAREGRVSTCGMLAVSGCQCVSGKCENLLQSDESLPAAPAELK